MALSSTRFQLGAWFVEPGVSRLTKGDETIRLEPRAMEVLVYLAERVGDLVSKQELIDNVWRAEIVAQGSLTAIISQLRSALQDKSSHPEYIETIHTKGYRLVAEVEPLISIHDLRGRRSTGDTPGFVFPERDPTTPKNQPDEGPTILTEAEAGLLQSIEIARAQGQRYQELRAAVRLAGLWKDQGRIDEALGLLQPIVEGFTDDIETVPLLEAKALLWDLIDRPG